VNIVRITKHESSDRHPEEPSDENPGRTPDLKRALRLVPAYERAVREVSRMLSEAGIRHALVGALGANAYRNRPRTTEDIVFLVGDEAFESHAGGFVTMRVPVVEFDGIDVDQVPLTEPSASWKRD
jgi:hypothetical protein